MNDNSTKLATFKLP